MGSDASTKSEEAASATSIPTEDRPAGTIPGSSALVDAVERDRVFAALFGTRTERPRFGRYVVLGTLGRGGMGTVLEAYDEHLERRLAIKVLHADTGERDAKRLLREARALAKLSHPNVVQVYEAGEVDGQVYIAMELVRGESLQRWQRELRPWRDCVGVYLQAARGLAAAHAVGLVHRDFKPGNCIVDGQGRVRVLDFGLARKLDTTTLASSSAVAPKPQSFLTSPGAVLGTLAYMPLEQLQGWPADARSDQFSFCVSLYEAIHGERPFRGESMSTTRLPPPPKGIDVPPRLRRVLQRGLAVGPHDRWPSMDALAGELERLLAPRRSWWRAEPGGLRRWLLRGLESMRAVLSAGDEPRAGVEAEASLLAGIGVLLASQGRHEEALDHHRRALVMFERALGPGHPSVALSHASLGAALQELGRREEALVHRRRAQAIYERALGEGHPQRAHLLRGLADEALAGHGPDEARGHR